jgi:hypothetical protein
LFYHNEIEIFVNSNRAHSTLILKARGTKEPFNYNKVLDAVTNKFVKNKKGFAKYLNKLFCFGALQFSMFS